jgi:hypothetical protein
VDRVLGGESELREACALMMENTAIRGAVRLRSMMVVGVADVCAFEIVTRNLNRYINARKRGSSGESPMKPMPVAGDVPVLWEAGALCLDLREIDVPPKPLVAIVELIDRADTGDTVRVLIARDPVNLYPELVERGWSWTKEFAEDGGLRLILTRELPEQSGAGR